MNHLIFKVQKNFTFFSLNFWFVLISVVYVGKFQLLGQFPFPPSHIYYAHYEIYLHMSDSYISVSPQTAFIILLSVVNLGLDVVLIFLP